MWRSFALFLGLSVGTFRIKLRRAVETLLPDYWFFIEEILLLLNLEQIK